MDITRKKIEWRELSSNNISPDKIRSVETEGEYSAHKSITKELLGGMEEYANIYYVDPFAAYIIKKNRYPYNLTKDIQHYVLWCSPRSDITYMVAEVIAEARFPKKELFVKQNIQSQRTIQSIKHYHIFVRA